MPGFNGVEKVVGIYIVFTLVLAAMLIPSMEISTFARLVAERLAIVAGTLLLVWIYKRRPCHATYQLRVVYQVALLGYWYPDIYNIAGLMPSRDHLLAQADQLLFGCQPSVLFSQILSGSFWNELFKLGYFSYYLMIIGIVLLVIVWRPRRFDRVTFIFMTTFFMYYVVFLLFNSAGPQFYFAHPGVDVDKAVFPDIDTWFKNHSELNHMSDVTGPFSWLVHCAQGNERPIAAFPSSHVGMSTIILLLVFRLKKAWGYIMVPFWLLLCMATVYIGAHYLIDVVGGLISAFLFIYIANRLYRTRFFHRPRRFDELHRLGHHHHHHHHTSD